MKYFLLLSFLVISVSQTEIYSQNLEIKIYYLNGEKSKDSHSTTENISISGNSVSYSVKYSGRKGNNQQDNQKECTFTEQSIEDIKKTILLKGLNSSDSLYQESSKTKLLEYYFNISMDITMNGEYFRISLNGDPNDFDRSNLYVNSISFIDFLRNLISDCS